MRQALSHWFRISRAHEVDLWKNGLFSFDASALLNIYAYSNETRNELVALIEENADRVRLPHQFGLEYARNRSVVIVKQVNNYLKAEKELRIFQEQQIENKREHPYLGENSIKALKTVRDDLTTRRKEMEGLIGADSYADKILTLFDGKVCQAPTAEELPKLHQAAKERFTKNRPPGYADLKEKGEPDAFGDYVGWTQLIEIAKREGKGIILVLDDLKEDWWLIEQERTIGPRPELIEEFLALSGQHIWMYTSVNFLRAAKEFQVAKIGDEAIREIADRLASQLEVKYLKFVSPEKAHFDIDLSDARRRFLDAVEKAGTREDSSEEKSTTTEPEKSDPNSENE